MAEEKEVNILDLINRAKTQRVEVDIFKHLYMLFKDRAVTESEALEFDLTDLFWQGIKDKVTSDELLVILIRGEVRTWKSTTGAKIKREVNKLIYSLKKRPTPVNEYKTIMADQTEFIRFIKLDERELCILIDEYNTMAEGGANASTEQQIYQTYGDVFASRHVHRISCNPTHLSDSNAFIHLETMGKLKGKDGFSRCKLIYQDNVEGVRQTLGHVDIYTWDVVENWETRIKDTFYKINKTDADKAYLEKEKEKDWYVKYYIKKEKRQDLLIKEGVRDIRELEFSTVVMGVYKELRELAEVGKLKQEVILSTIKDVCRREGKIYSMYAELDVMTKVKSLLGLITELTNYKKKLKTVTKSGKVGWSYKYLGEDRNNIVIGLKKVQEIFNRRLHEEARLCNLYEQYLNIE